jgi:hypothetical protein
LEKGPEAAAAELAAENNTLVYYHEETDPDWILTFLIPAVEMSAFTWWPFAIA